MNMVNLIGRLTADPRVRTAGQSQTAVCDFSIAIDRGKDRNGNDLGADFPSVVCFGRQAELVGQYVKKGHRVGVQGRLQTRSYENREGKKVYVTEVAADRVEFLEPRREGGGSKPAVPEGFVREPDPSIDTTWTMEDIPF